MIPMGKNAVINNMSNVCNTIAFFFFHFFHILLWYGEFYPGPSLK